MSTLKVGYSVEPKKGNSATVDRAMKSVYMHLGVGHVLARRVRVVNRLNTLHKSKL